MKTIVCLEPNSLVIEKKESPILKNPSDIKVLIKRVGICGTDIHAFSGNQPFFAYPRVLGHELSGVVEEIGSNVSGIQVGDLVTVIPYIHCGKCVSCRCGKTNCCLGMQVLGVHIDGGMAESIIVPSTHVLPVNQLSIDMATIVEPLSIGAHAVRRSDVQQGETVLIIGAGPIGLGVAKFAKLQGARTIMMDISVERLKFAMEWTGCDSIVQASENSLQEILNLNSGDLPTIVYDATGNKNSMMKSFDYVGHGGKLVYVGLVKDTISFFNPDFHSKEITLYGSRNATKDDFQYVVQCMNEGNIKENYISEVIGFEETISHFERGNFQSNKILIRFSE